jgi:hypothetical protein
VKDRLTQRDLLPVRWWTKLEQQEEEHLALMLGTLGTKAVLCCASKHASLIYTSALHERANKLACPHLLHLLLRVLIWRVCTITSDGKHEEVMYWLVFETTRPYHKTRLSTFQNCVRWLHINVYFRSSRHGVGVEACHAQMDSGHVCMRGQGRYDPKLKS